MDYDDEDLYSNDDSNASVEEIALGNDNESEEVVKNFEV